MVRGCVHQKAPAPQKKVLRWAFPKKEAPKPPVAKKVREAKMAIILDDWGNNYSLVKQALAIDRPITLSILPHLSHSQSIAVESFSHQLGIMLHMPMQPKGTKEPLEPQTIFVTTPDEEIRRYLDEALVSVPHAEGVNNHQGSAATSDPRVMRTVLSYLNNKGLFFVDSHVIATSIVAKVARSVQIPFEERDVFIDNESKGPAIKKRLEEAKEIALSRGEVVVIGHDKRVTLEAIKEVVPKFEKEGVKFVLVKELLNKANA